MAASAHVLGLLPRQLTTPLRSALAPAAPSRAAARGSFSFSILPQQPHRCWASSICEQYAQAPIRAAPGGATRPACPHDGKGEGDGEAAARGGEKGAQQDVDSKGPGAPSPRAPKEKEALRAAAAAGRNGRSGATSGPRQQQRGRAAKPQVNKPARPGPPKQGRGGGGGIIHDVTRSSSASSASPSSSSSTPSTRLRATKKQESED